MVVASCHRIGFGVQKDAAKAQELELEAAGLGSLVGQMTALFYSLLDGFNIPIPAEEKVAWLKRAVCAICFQGTQEPAAAAVQDRFRAAIDAVPDKFLEVSLLHSFIEAYMTEWEVLDGEFDGAADDSLFGLVVSGDLEGLRARLSSDRTLLERRKDGFTLLHVATDYCYEQIIRGKASNVFMLLMFVSYNADFGPPELIQKFNVSPNISSDAGITAIEMAARTGSIECLRLLLSLGADPQPLADQHLFTSVAMTGVRKSAERSPVTGTRTLLSLIRSVVESNYSDESTPGDETQAAAADAVAVQELLDGRYRVKVEDLAACGSPLEICISVSNYTSVFSLLGLGADPDVFNHHLPPLHVAVSLREPVLTALLLAYGADPNLRARGDYNQDTPLHQADAISLTAFYDPPRNQVTTYTEYLGDGIEAVDTGGDAAIAARIEACIAVLLFGGADIEARDAKGNTPLVRRVIEGDFDTAEYLISRGADLHAIYCGGREVGEKIGERGVRWCAEHGVRIKGEGE
jgi:ankyrin repeat protein